VLVGDEEESCAWGGTNNGGADASVDAAEAACCGEAGGGLKASFESVERIEGEVDGCACESAGLGVRMVSVVLSDRTKRGGGG